MQTVDLKRTAWMVATFFRQIVFYTERGRRTYGRYAASLGQARTHEGKILRYNSWHGWYSPHAHEPGAQP